MFKRKKTQMETVDYWISYSDLMAGAMMVIILFLFVAILNYNTNKNKLDKQEQKIEEIIGTRTKIIRQLDDAFKEKGIEVKVHSDTGDISLRSAVFFDSASYQLKNSGKDFLREFLSIYLEVLLDESNRNIVSEIIIEGHTDMHGSYMYNLELSQKRALEVSRFIYSDEFKAITQEEKKLLEKVLTSNGRSFSQVKMNEYNVVDEEASRRVEFRFRVKDTELIEKIEEIIKGES